MEDDTSATEINESAPNEIPDVEETPDLLAPESGDAPQATPVEAAPPIPADTTQTTPVDDDDLVSVSATSSTDNVEQPAPKENDHVTVSGEGTRVPPSDWRGPSLERG